MATIRKLEVASPVPADIDVANSVKPLHISAIADELGLKPEEYDCYGKSKAKVTDMDRPSHTYADVCLCVSGCIAVCGFVSIQQSNAGTSFKSFEHARRL